MKVAVTYENGNVFQHFGHTEQFKLYDIKDGKVAGMEVLSAQGSGHGALAVFLKDMGVDALICGGIGAGAKNALADAKIELYPGVSGSADDAVSSFLEGNLVYHSEIQCEHHSEGHHYGEDKHGCSGNGGSCR